MGMRECCGHVGLHKTVSTHEEKSEALNVECKLIKELNIGSHTIFFGEV